MTHHVLTFFMVAMTAMLLSWRWFHIAVSKKVPKPLSAHQRRRAALLEARATLWSAAVYLHKRKGLDSPERQLLLDKTRDIDDALDALERSPFLSSEEKPVLLRLEGLAESLSPLVGKTIARIERRSNGAVNIVTTDAPEFLDHVTQMSDSSLFDDICMLCGATDASSALSKPCPNACIQTCTRPAPHLCTENGPCNGFPKEEGVNPIMGLKHF